MLAPGLCFCVCEALVIPHPSQPCSLSSLFFFFKKAEQNVFILNNAFKLIFLFGSCKKKNHRILGTLWFGRELRSWWTLIPQRGQKSLEYLGSDYLALALCLQCQAEGAHSGEPSTSTGQPRAWLPQCESGRGGFVLPRHDGACGLDGGGPFCIPAVFRQLW